MNNLNSIDVYGSFCAGCEIWAMGYYKNGSTLDDAMDNNFNSKEGALRAVASWADRIGAKVEEVNFISKGSL
jgi:hypothetical protein